MQADAPTRARRSSRAEATRAEIVVVSRRLLNQQRELSLRAVAAEMGVSAPALYRYVESVNQLITLASAEILDDVTNRVIREAASFENDPIARIAVGAVSFRHWALAHPEEFRVVFTTTRTFERSQRDDLVTGRQEAGARFVTLFASIFADLISAFHVPIPRAEDLDPEVLAAVVQHDPWMLGAPTDAPPGFLWLFQLGWTKLYGVITLEVFGHVQQSVVDTGALLIAALREIGFQMGLGEQVERVTHIAREQVRKLNEE